MIYRFNKIKREKIAGFTLTELLVVISIIVILMILSLVYLRNQILKGNDAKRKGDIHKIQIAVEEYEKDNDCYPPIELVVCDPGDGLKPYVSKIPCDPTTGDSYFYEVDDPNCASWYRVYTNLQNLSDTDIAGACGPGYAFNYYETSPNAPDPDCTDPGNGNGNGDPPKDYYGCRDGVCVKIKWDPQLPGPECDPNYLSSTCCINEVCYCIDEDGDPDNECVQ